MYENVGYENRRESVNMSDFNFSSEQIAKLLHQFTSLIPRPDGSMPAPWESLSEKSKEYAIKAVEHIYKNEFRFGTRHPRDFHRIWMDALVQDGWTCGEYSIENKTHPCIVSYDELPHTEQFKDVVWRDILTLCSKYYDSWSYDEEIADDDDVYSVKDFKDAVAQGVFVDYDGFGSPAKNNKTCRSVIVLPSQVDRIPHDATHIVWYNK